MSELKKDDHILVLAEPFDGISPALKLGEDGVYLCTVTHGREGDGIELERCESGSSGGALVLHQKGSTSHPGPVRVINSAYSDGYDRIKWDKNKSLSDQSN